MKTLLIISALILSTASFADNCNMTPPYYTYLGVCYQGNPSINISNPTNPQPVTVTSTPSSGPVGVPEPSTLPLLMLGFVLMASQYRRRI